MYQVVRGEDENVPQALVLKMGSKRRVMDSELEQMIHMHLLGGATSPLILYDGDKLLWTLRPLDLQAADTPAAQTAGWGRDEGSLSWSRPGLLVEIKPTARKLDLSQPLSVAGDNAFVNLWQQAIRADLLRYGLQPMRSAFFDERQNEPWSIFGNGRRAIELAPQLNLCKGLKHSVVHTANGIMMQADLGFTTLYYAINILDALHNEVRKKNPHAQSKDDLTYQNVKAVEGFFCSKESERPLMVRQARTYGPGGKHACRSM
jgi:hypothetical protein